LSGESCEEHDGVSDVTASLQTVPVPAPTLGGHPGEAFATLASATLAAADEPPVVPGYRPLRQLAQGGMGAVWLAEHQALKRTVALKVMRPELARDQGFVDRFVREARAAARISHPGVVAVHDAGVAGGHLFLAMEYVPGGDLAGRLARGTVPEAEAVALIVRIADGLQAIHDAGLVHRDLKPENILLDESGQPKIADLGLARASEGDDRMTQTGQALGTPAYMSPEQANGASDIDGRSDVYSLAATLYALVTGRPPFTGPSPWATVAKVLHEPAPDPRGWAPGLTPAVAASIVRGLAKEREQRQASARAFAEELLAAPSVDAGIAPRPVPWWRAPTLLAIGGAYAAAIGLGCLIAFASAAPADARAWVGAGATAAPAPPPAATPTRPPTPVPAPADHWTAPAPAPALAARSTPPAPTDTAPPSAASWRVRLPAALASLTTAAPAPPPLVGTIDARIETTVRAVLAALHRNGLRLTGQRQESDAAIIDAAFTDGGPVRLRLARLAGDRTRVAIEAAGDDARARRLLEWLRDEL
jgi:tRNA A-37 threonylcarbamoyl transferase component Bud32